MRNSNNRQDSIFSRQIAAPILVVLTFVGTMTICGTAFADLIDEIDELEGPQAPVVDRSKPPTPNSIIPSTPSTPSSSPAPTGPPTLQPSQQQPSKTGASNAGSDQREPVYFESMGLQGQRSQGLINLLDKVVVTQGDMRMEADKATVHFDQKTEEVSRVVALGNVKILRIDPETKQKVRAESNEVLFNNLERKVTLKGNAKLWRGADLIRGKQIVYELDTGWIKADRVEGVVQPGESEGGPKSNPKPAPAKPASIKNTSKGGR